MNQYLFTYLNQKYGLKVLHLLSRVSLLKPLTTSSQEYSNIQQKTMISQFSAKSFETK